MDSLFSTNLGRTICKEKVIPLRIPARTPIIFSSAPLAENTSIMHIQPIRQSVIITSFFLLIGSPKKILPKRVAHIGFENISTVATLIGMLSTDKL